MKSRVFALIKLMEELGLPVSRLMGQSSNVLPITKPVLTKSTIDLSSVNTKSLAKESTDTLNLLRNNKLSGQEIEQTIRNLQDIKATTQAKPRSATIIKLSTKEAIPTEGVMNLAKQQEMSKSIPGKAKQLQGRVENIEKDFTDFTKALDARGEIPGASRQEAIEIAKAKMKGMGYAAEEIEDIAKDPKRIQIATDIIIPDEGFQMGGRVGLEKGSKPPKVKTTIPMNPMMEEGFDPGKRGFLKGTGAAGLGLAALGTGAVRLGKRAKKIKDIDIDMGLDVDGDYSDVAERYEAFYNTFFKIKANTKAGKKVLDKLAKEKKIVKEKDGTYSADTYGDIDSPAIDALEDIKNQSSYNLSFEGKKFKNTDEASDYFRGTTKEASPLKPDSPYDYSDDFLTEDMGEVVDILAPKPITKQIKEEVEKRIRNVEREARRTKRAVGGRVGYSKGGITALKTLIRFLGKDSGKKGSQMLKEINPKQFGYKFDMLDPEMKKQINDNRLKYIEQLSDSIKADQKMFREIKDLPEEWQDFMLKQANEGGNKGRLDVYNDIDIDSAVEEIEQLKKNLEFKNIPAKEVKRKMNAKGGRIEMFVGGSVYDQYQNYLNQVNSQSSDPLYSNILYNQPSMNDTGSGDDDIDVTKDQTVGSSKALDYYNNNLGYLGRTGVNSLIGMVNPMLGAVGQMYNQGKSLYDVGRNVLGYNNFGRTMGYDFYGDLGGGIADPSTGSFSTNPGIGFSNRDPEDTQNYGGSGSESSGAAGTGNSNASEPGGSDSMGSF